MKTKFLDYKIAVSKFYCRDVSHEEQRFGRFSYLYCRLAVSEFKSVFLNGDREGTTKKLCDRDFAECSGELSGAICLRTLVYWVMTSKLLELFRNSLVLFVRFFAFVSPFWLLI